MTMIDRRSRPGERGQSLTLLVLTMATMGVMAMLAVTIGQAVVRRHQAQLVVDAAALAGAAEQAKGLNTIARINARQLDFLNALALAQAKGVISGYEDSLGTTSMRMLRALCPLCWGDDWAIENWKRYDGDVFGRLNAAVTAVNLAYLPHAKPNRAAKKVIDDNFSDSNDLFKGEAPDAGLVIPFYEFAAFAEKRDRLVEIRPLRQYRIGGARWYKANPRHYASTCPEMIGIVPNPPCIAARRLKNIGYAKENAIFNVKAVVQGDVPRYRLGNFYGTPKSRDVRFTYYLQVDAAKPIFGAGYLYDIPPIVVMASAKPYAGHLGDPFDERAGSSNIVSLGYTEDQGNEIAPTYRAKLVPVRLVDRLQLSQQLGSGGDDAARFINVFH